MTHGLPPFVLVHGAFHGGWCWKPIARILRAGGYEVYTPTQTGLGERCHLLSADITMDTFVSDVANVLVCEELEDVVLVGHSFGARSVSGVADLMPERIRRLVFIDGGLALEGKSRLETMSDEARNRRIAAAAAHDGGLSIPPPSATTFDIVDPILTEWLERRLTAQPLSVENTRFLLKNPFGNGLPITYIHCVAPEFESTGKSAGYARDQSNWRFEEFVGGHDSIITHPVEISALLIEAAK